MLKKKILYPPMTAAVLVFTTINSPMLNVKLMLCVTYDVGKQCRLRNTSGDSQLTINVCSYFIQFSRKTMPRCYNIIFYLCVNYNCVFNI